MVGAAAWASYNEAQAGRAVRPLCAELLRLAGPGRGRTALDLGCGAGVETRALVDAGWRVTAIDSDATVRARMSDLLQTGAVEVLVRDLHSEPLPASDLVHSSRTLPFVRPTDFGAVWARIRTALLPGGWLGVDLFGPRDDWFGEAGLSFHDRATVEGLVAGLDDVRLEEREWDGPPHDGPDKHWHVIQVIARRP
jgi:trans-aconitate methyltransferase